MGREWIKLYVDKWLDGSISWELTDAQVGVWSKILALAGRYYREGKREGLIPLSKEAIQHAIKSRRRIFERAWDKLIETDRIKVVEEGVFVVNYMRLNPSRWEVWAASHPDEAGKDRHKPSQTPTNTLKQTQALETDTETDREYITIEDIKSSEWYSTFKADYPQFKDSDLAAALDWIEAHPSKKPKLIKRFLINWAKKGCSPYIKAKDLGEYD